MAVPSLPAQGSPNWFAWAQGLHSEVATGRLSDAALSAAYRPVISVRKHGGQGDGTADDTTAINAAVAEAAAIPGGAEVFIPRGSWRISAPITLPATAPVGLVGEIGTTITATAAMTAMISKPSGAGTSMAVRGIDLNGNRLADRCLDIEAGLRVDLRGGIWQNALVAVADFGRQGGQVYEMIWRDTRVVGLDSAFAGATPAGMPQYGYRLGAQTTDSVIENVVVKNALVGIEDGGNVNVHDKVHVFGFPYLGATNYVGTCGFRATGDLNRFINCYADTQILGFDLVGNRNSVIDPMFYWPLDYLPGVNVIGVRVAGLGNTIAQGKARLPNSGIAGYFVQIENNARPTVVLGCNIYGTGWLSFFNLVGSGNAPFAAANAWDVGTVPHSIDLAGGTLTAGSANLGGADISGAAATNRELRLRTGTSTRFTLRAGNGAETGTGAAGSDLFLNSHKDDGSFGFTVAQVQRGHGMWTLPRSEYRIRATQTLAANGAVAIDSAAANQHRILLQANATSSTANNASSLVGTGVLNGQELTITWQQDATGGRTYVWPGNCRFAGGTAPADTTLNTRTSVTFVYEGGVWCETARAVAVPAT